MENAGTQQHVLVTGGAGFVGSHLVDALLDAGQYVTVLDDLSTGKVQNIAHHLDNPSFRFMEGSVLDSALVERLVAESHAVYHLAAAVGVKHIIDDPLHGMKVNVLGTEMVLEAAAQYNRKTLVVSSSEAYGKSLQVPLQEDANSLLGPTTVPRWSYALAKLLDEQLALAYYRQKGLATVVVRYFNAYGPRLDPRGYGSVVARFISQAFAGGPLTVYGDGKQTRAFTYVLDTVRGTIAAMTMPGAEGKVLNIGCSHECTIEALASRVRDVLGIDLEITYVPYAEAYGSDFEETLRRLPDTNRAKELLGFQAAVSLEEGLQRTIRWFEEHQDELIEA